LGIGSTGGSAFACRRIEDEVEVTTTRIKEVNIDIYAQDTYF
jgi:hypothetical protein